MEPVEARQQESQLHCSNALLGHRGRRHVYHNPGYHDILPSMVLHIRNSKYDRFVYTPDKIQNQVEAIHTQRPRRAYHITSYK